MFKGVAIRYMTLLTELPDLDDANRTKYANFLKQNAQSLYVKGIARPTMMISPDWAQQSSGPTDLTTQLSGVMMIEAAAKLKAAAIIK